MNSIVNNERETDIAVQNARCCLYQFFALALSDPLSERAGRLYQPGFLETVSAAAEFIRAEAKDESVTLAPGERPPSALDLQRARPQREVRGRERLLAPTAGATVVAPMLAAWNAESTPDD